MAKREFCGIFIPAKLWGNPYLSWIEKIVLMEVNSYEQETGATIGNNTLASSLNIPVKEIKEIIKSLIQKQALTVSVNEYGAKVFTTNLYKDVYTISENGCTKQLEKIEQKDYFDYERIAHEWATINPTMPPIQRWTPAKKRKLKNAMTQANLKLDDLYKIFRIISFTPFLSGQNDKFRATFSWICTAEHLSKIYEGFYCRSFQEKKDYAELMGVAEQPLQETTNQSQYIYK